MDMSEWPPWLPFSCPPGYRAGGRHGIEGLLVFGDMMDESPKNAHRSGPGRDQDRNDPAQ